VTGEQPQTVVREIVAPARPETVWEFLTTDKGWAAWWGAGSSIDAVPGGAMTIIYPDGRSAIGTVLAVTPTEAISFTYGYPREDPPIPLEGSVVEITLRPAPGGTAIRIEHHVADEATRRLHDPGWRFQLGLFRSAIVTGTLAAGLAATIDAWHAVWGIDDPADRRAALAAVVTPDVTVDEPMAALTGLGDVDGWIAQSRAHLPATVRRTTPAALCGDHATWDWEITAAGATLATGRSVARLTPETRLASVTAFWLTAPRGFQTSLVAAT
jgi:uncharacterized protein YndB with AHSA1/START domain